MPATDRYGNLVYPGRPKDAPADLEPRAIDFARSVLSDVPCYRDATYTVRWVDSLPVLVIEFDSAATSAGAVSVAVPALGIALVKVNDGTLMEAYPGHEMFRGDKLKRHILTAAFDYLKKCGIPLRLAGA